MSTIEPGTPVRVVIDGTYEYPGGGDPAIVETKGGWLYPLTDADESDDPAVTVTPLDPERPTLDRDTIAWQLHKHHWPLRCWDGEYTSTRTRYLSLADAMLTLIQAAHPEWIE